MQTCRLIGNKTYERNLLIEGIFMLRLILLRHVPEVSESGKTILADRQNTGSSDDIRM